MFNSVMKKISAQKSKRDVLQEQLEQLKVLIRKKFSIPKNYTLDYVSEYFGLPNIIPFGKNKIELKKNWWVYTMFCNDKWKKILFDKKMLNKMLGITENIIRIQIGCKRKNYLFPMKHLHDMCQKKTDYFIVVGKEKRENVTAIVKVNQFKNKTK